MNSARKRVVLADSELTPQARLERAARQIAAGQMELARAAAELAASANDWVDQNSSPLGKRRHLLLVNQGKLEARKEGKKVLVRRHDMDAYIQKHGKPRGARTPDDEEVDDILETITHGGRG